MKCHEIDDLINEYLNGYGSIENQMELEEHVEKCPACKEKYEVFLEFKREMRETNSEEKVMYQNTKKEDRIFYNEMWQKIHRRQYKGKDTFIWMEVVVLCILILISILFPDIPISQYGSIIGVLVLSAGGVYLHVGKRKDYEHVE